VRVIHVGEGKREGKGQTYTAHGPEQVGVLALVGGHDVALGGHNFHFKDLVGSKPIVGGQHTMTGTSNVAAHGNGPSTASHDGLVDGIQFPV
jgi:hypothetical protein